MTGFDLTDCRFAVLETLKNGDWEALPLDGKGERILLVEPDSHTLWVVTIAPASLEVTPGTEPAWPEVELRPDEPLVCIRCGGRDRGADGEHVCPTEPLNAGHTTGRAHAEGCTQPDDHVGPCIIRVSLADVGITPQEPIAPICEPLTPSAERRHAELAPRIVHEDGCTGQHEPNQVCRDASGADLTIPF